MEEEEIKQTWLSAESKAPRCWALEFEFKSVGSQEPHKVFEARGGIVPPENRHMVVPRIIFLEENMM